MNYFGSIFAMVVCIAMSSYFSATETAFSSLNKTRLKVLADNGNKRAALALKLSEDYDKLISTGFSLFSVEKAGIPLLQDGGQRKNVPRGTASFYGGYGAGRRH